MFPGGIGYKSSERPIGKWEKPVETEGSGAEKGRGEGKSSPLERSQHFRHGAWPPRVPGRQVGQWWVGCQREGVFVVS